MNYTQDMGASTSLNLARNIYDFFKDRARSKASTPAPVPEPKMSDNTKLMIGGGVVIGTLGLILLLKKKKKRG